MSESRANELLQLLFAGLKDNWEGKPSAIRCGEDAYRLCEEIVKEAREEFVRVKGTEKWNTK